uniref:HTH HARE-type domain-containing protein n=1 Tax=Acanthochromis polyacanthus TaxID=80966 RepID=A0A3Q1FCY8_9TELE
TCIVNFNLRTNELRTVLENFSDAPMTPKQILHVIQTKGLKEMRGTAPLACLVTMLHSQVRGDRVKNSIFFKLPGRMSLFTLKVIIHTFENSLIRHSFVA